MFASAVHRCVTFEPEEGEKSEGSDGHVRCAVVEGEDFRQNVEQGDRQHGAGTEAKQQMKAVAQADGGSPTQAGGDERDQGE